MKYNRQSSAYQNYSNKNYSNKNYLNKNTYHSKSTVKLIKSKSTKILGISPFQAIMLLIILICMVSYLIFSKLTLDKIGDEIVKYEKNYENLINEKIRLEVDMESKISLKNIEDIANEKGLTPIQDYQIEYVDFKSEDNVELVNKKTNIFVTTKNFFTKLLSYIK